MNKDTYFLTKIIGVDIVSASEISSEAILNYTNRLTYIESELSIFVKAFKNQRKMYKFLQASIAFDEQDITEDEFDKISDECVMFIKNTSEEETYQNILSLLKYTEDNFTIDEISQLLEVSVNECTNIIYDVNTSILDLDDA